MKLIYFLIFLFTLLLTGYLAVNNFSFDNISFSNYLINTLFILLLSCVSLIAAFGIMYFMYTRRRSAYDKDMMTIRQYYQYKSAR